MEEDKLFIRFELSRITRALKDLLPFLNENAFSDESRMTAVEVNPTDKDNKLEALVRFEVNSETSIKLHILVSSTTELSLKLSRYNMALFHICRFHFELNGNVLVVEVIPQSTRAKKVLHDFFALTAECI